MISYHLDLFSGIGGFAIAAQKAGFVTNAFVEIDPFCRKVLQKNFPGVDIVDDIREYGWYEHAHLVTAGFPCQPFSQAGNKRGIDDERYLWPETLRVIVSTCPTWIILENVPGIINMELDNILIDLEAEGYTPETFVLPACAANAPHRRDRVWIIAHINSIRSNQRFSDWKKRFIQTNQLRNLEEIQQKWTQFIPDTWKAYTAKDWLAYNTTASRRNNGVSTRLDKDRIKALGNAIVPQVIYPIMEFIKESL